MQSTSSANTRGVLWTAIATCGLLIVAIALAACGNGYNSSGASGMATANVMLSDPATCAGPTGPFAHVYVTITDVQANVSATAGNTDPGWTDLTPGLSSQPKQVDLLGQANSQCFLANLGATQELQAGTYQQIRIMLAADSVTVANNACGNSANCVILSSDGSVHSLLLSSESQTGLKIPSGQIASGGFTIAAGQTKDLDIDFNTCASIVEEGNGQYRLKPVLHAGEVSTTNSSINGTVVDRATGNPVSGQVVVALEQPDSTGVDRILMATLTANDGSFVFCPVPTGSFDIVVVGERTTGTAYDPSIVTGVANGDTTGTIALYLGPTGTSGVGTLSGVITSQNSSNQGTVTDIQLSALETVTGNSSTYTIPLLPNAQQTSSTPSLETAPASTCPTGTDCTNYSVMLPAGGPYVGTYSTSSPTLTQASPLASYVMDGLAFVPSSGGTADCSPSEEKTQTAAFTAGGSLTLSVQTMAFVGCQ